MSRNLVIFLHGVGSNGADFAAIETPWSRRLPETDFASPDGPEPFGTGPGFQWFDIRGVTDANRPGRVEDGRKDFDRTLASIIDAHGLSAQLDRVALVGFSQGSIMALDALASGRWPLRAVVAFSGRLASPAPLVPVIGSKALLVHGSADQMIPPGETERAAAKLAGLGIDVTAHILPGLGHAISPGGWTLAEEFLATNLAAPR